MGYKLKQLAKELGVKLHGDENVVVNSVAPVDKAAEGDICFVSSARYIDNLRSTSASAVIIKEEMLEETDVSSLVVDNPRATYARVVNLLYPLSRPDAGVHPSASIDETAKVSESAYIGANVVIEEKAEIADNVIVEAGCVIGRNSKIGKSTHLYPNVTVYYECSIGEHCILHSSSVIGSDGFGFEFDKTEWLKISQIGGVRIGDKVEIGACSIVDRGALNDTVIEDGVKLDNHVQIAHNVHIGAHTLMSRGVGVGGSTKVGANCLFAGMVGIRDNIEITDNVIITAMTLVSSSIKKAGSYSSPTPMDDTRSWRKNSVRFRQLDDMAKRIRDLEKQIKNKG
ncbi:MAG: UDP-3-O-(3-hydroxymyristoyl)glucosamine N-acyltransferase [endosymbiont of Galathealinum brachiosum]|uniref:UDP-3-O-acylglucosamine N-acyltransferase n=1 Tax=endosymbiont of Galathealinum brachiosum TaxID=2200906 RepID=A0A370DM88_9GAMM|nr:MAG: UDP-3-O-(3-hydroxymyristoyl)glucosamine N-acyltransferase [endosymbiont of Galathealinum brachiosum]